MGDFSTIIQQLSELYRHAAGKADDVRRTEEAKYKNKIEELELKVKKLLSEAKVQEDRLREASVNEKEVLERRIESISFECAAYKAQLSSAEERIKILDSTDSLSTIPLYIYDSSDVNISKIRSMYRKLKLEKGLGLIIVDYLRLMSITGRTENRQQETCQISRNLRVLAGEINVPVIALSQLNCGLESRSDKRPGLSDLQESGVLEQDADMVVFLHRKGYYNPQKVNPNSVKLIIKKQRNVPTGTVNLTWLPRYTKFEDAEY